MTASTQCVRPATQSLALDGSYCVVRPGSSCVQPMKGGSAAQVAAGAIRKAAATAATTTRRDTIRSPLNCLEWSWTYPVRQRAQRSSRCLAPGWVAPSAYRVARIEQEWKDALAP